MSDIQFRDDVPGQVMGLYTPRMVLAVKGLNPIEKDILSYFLGIEGAKDQKNTIFVTNGHLAKIFDVTTIYISKVISSLEEKGLITRILRYNKEKKVEERIISTKPLRDAWDNLDIGVHVEDSEEQPKEDVPEVQPKKTENKDKPKQPKKTGYTEEFEQFIKTVYTKKRAKASSFKAFNKALKKVSYQELVEIVDIYKDWADLKYSSLDFMMNFENFISQEKYLEKEDMIAEIETMKKNPGQKKYPEQQPVQGNNKFDFGFVNPQ